MLKKIFFSCLALVFTGCAVKQYEFVNSKQDKVYEISEPSNDAAQIVFLRPSKGVMGAFNAVIIDVSNEQHNILGVSTAISKFVVEIAPGKHTLFSTHGFQGHIMEVNVEAGKRYYVLVRPIYGNGFQLRPIKHNISNEFGFNNPEFEQWVSDTSYVSMGEGAKEWYKDFYEGNQKILSKAKAVWSEKDIDQKYQLTLMPEDAVMP